MTADTGAAAAPPALVPPPAPASASWSSTTSRGAKAPGPVKVARNPLWGRWLAASEQALGLPSEAVPQRSTGVVAMRHHAGWSRDDVGSEVWVSDASEGYLPGVLTGLDRGRHRAHVELVAGLGGGLVLGQRGGGLILEVDLAAPLLLAAAKGGGGASNSGSGAPDNTGELEAARLQRLLPRIAPSPVLSELVAQSGEPGVGVEDMDDLPVLHEAAILDNGNRPRRARTHPT